MGTLPTGRLSAVPKAKNLELEPLKDHLVPGNRRTYDGVTYDAVGPEGKAGSKRSGPMTVLHEVCGAVIRDMSIPKLRISSSNSVPIVPLSFSAAHNASFAGLLCNESLPQPHSPISSWPTCHVPLPPCLLLDSLWFSHSDCPRSVFPGNIVCCPRLQHTKQYHGSVLAPETHTQHIRTPKLLYSTIINLCVACNHPPRLVIRLGDI